jgi:hypothetical protein
VRRDCLPLRYYFIDLVEYALVSREVERLLSNFKQMQDMI